MPTIKEFNGFSIKMYFEDHGRPHFHVRAPDFSASVAIDDLSILSGSLPKKAKAALDWAKENRQLLESRWKEYSG